MTLRCIWLEVEASAATVVNGPEPIWSLHEDRTAVVRRTRLEQRDPGAATVPSLEAARLLREILTQGGKADVFDIPDPRITAQALEGMAQQVAHGFDPDVDEPEHTADEYVRMVRRMVAASAH